MGYDSNTITSAKWWRNIYSGILWLSNNSSLRPTIPNTPGTNRAILYLNDRGAIAAKIGGDVNEQIVGFNPLEFPTSIIPQPDSRNTPAYSLGGAGSKRWANLYTVQAETDRITTNLDAVFKVPSTYNQTPSGTDIHLFIKNNKLTARHRDTTQSNNLRDVDLEAGDPNWESLPYSIIPDRNSNDNGGRSLGSINKEWHTIYGHIYDGNEINAGYFLQLTSRNPRNIGRPAANNVRLFNHGGVLKIKKSDDSTEPIGGGIPNPITQSLLPQVTQDPNTPGTETTSAYSIGSATQVWAAIYTDLLSSATGKPVRVQRNLEPSISGINLGRQNQAFDTLYISNIKLGSEEPIDSWDDIGNAFNPSQATHIIPKDDSQDLGQGSISSNKEWRRLYVRNIRSRLSGTAIDSNADTFVLFESPVKPSTAGMPFGTSTLNWDVYARNLNVTGTSTFAGNLIPSGSRNLGAAGNNQQWHQLFVQELWNKTEATTTSGVVTNNIIHVHSHIAPYRDKVVQIGRSSVRFDGYFRDLTAGGEGTDSGIRRFTWDY